MFENKLLNCLNFVAENIDTHCDITFDTAKGEISLSHLSISAKVPGISADKFNELVINAKENCPISKLLNTTITFDAKLN